MSESVATWFLNQTPEPVTPQPTDWKEILLASIGPTNDEDKFTHSGWQHIRSRITDALFRTHQPDSRIRSFLTCGRGGWIEAAKSDSSRLRLRVPYCHDRLCMVCGNHRSHRVRDALMQRVGDKPVSFITLTLSGRGEPLSELLDRLFKSFRALRLHPTWTDKVRGGAALLEIKHNAKSKRWHPHLHIIADADFIPQSELSDVWRGITKDSFIVDIRRVKNPAVAASYVTKYASKPMDTSFTMVPTLLDEAMIGLKTRRLCLTFGNWYGTSLDTAEDAPLADDMIDVDGYEKIHPLWYVLDAARAGDRWAIQLLCSLPGGEARWRRSLLDNSS